jgi:hypothetical protein
MAVALAASAAALDQPERITRSMAREYLVIQGQPTEQAPQDGSLQNALTEIHEHTLLALAWERGGRSLDDGQRSQLHSARDEVAARLCAERRLRVEPVTTTQQEDYAYLSGWLYLTRHILVETRQEAESLAVGLARGASFAELARAHSKDPGSAAQGGELGPVTTGQTVMEFEDALLRLRPGEVSRPVESPFGWHLIRLDSLVDRQIEFTAQDRSQQRETLERHARRRAELAARDQLWREHRIEIMREVAMGRGVAPGTVVARSADTSLTRGELDRMLAKAFGAREGFSAEGLGVDFLRYWMEQDAWLREARRDGTWASREVLDLVDLRERLLKSALCLSQDIMPAMRPQEEDLWNYFLAHETEFLAERAFGYWTFEFPTREAAESARALSRREKLGPAELARRLGLDIHPREHSADEVRALPAHLRNELIELEPDEWGEILENGAAGSGRRWLFYSLVGRRMPDLDQSPTLRRAVESRVKEQMVDAEIGRLVDEMRRRTGWTTPGWAD